jgi:hypothetical protein
VIRRAWAHLNSTARRLLAALSIFALLAGAVTNGGTVIRWVEDQFPGPEKSSVVLTNGDDQQVVFVNDRTADEVGYGLARKFDLGALKPTDRVTLQVFNAGGGYAWGFELRLGDRSVYCERAGAVGSVGAGGNDYGHANQVVRTITLTRAGGVLRSFGVGSGPVLRGRPCEEAIGHDVAGARL